MKNTKLRKKLRIQKFFALVNKIFITLTIVTVIGILAMHVLYAQTNNDTALYECRPNIIIPSPARSIGKPENNKPEEMYVSENRQENMPVEIQGIITESIIKRSYFNIPLDHNIQECIFSQSEKTGIPAELIIAIIRKESCFDPSVRSASNDTGLMQINDINLPELAELGLTDMYDPYQNIQAGVYLLKRCMDQGGEINPALMVYNMGYNRAKELWNQGILSSEYSRDIYKYYLEYKKAAETNP